MTTVFEDIAAQIAANSSTGLTYPGDVWASGERPADPEDFVASTGLYKVNNKAVFVGRPAIEGRSPQDTVGEKMELAAIPVFVVIRGDPGKDDEFDALCEDVMTAIDKRPPSGYVDVKAYGSGVANAMPDSRGCRRGHLRLEVLKHRSYP